MPPHAPSPKATVDAVLAAADTIPALVRGDAAPMGLLVLPGLAAVPPEPGAAFGAVTALALAARFLADLVTASHEGCPGNCPLADPAFLGERLRSAVAESAHMGGLDLDLEAHMGGHG